MKPSSRTPEGRRKECPLCGAEVTVEPSDFPTPDAPCPVCGHLLWFEAESPRTANPVARLPVHHQPVALDQRTPSHEEVRPDPIPEESLFRRLAKIRINVSTPSPITVFVLTLVGMGVFELLLWWLYGEPPQWSRRGPIVNCLLALLCCGFAALHRPDGIERRWRRFAARLSLTTATVLMLWFLIWMISLPGSMSTGVFAFVVFVTLVLGMVNLVTVFGLLAVVHQAVSCIPTIVRVRRAAG